MEQQISDLLHELRRVAPLVHNMTNYVAMNNTANALLAIGASPVMVHSRAEIKEVLEISQSLVINIGTLDENAAETMLFAAKTAKSLGCPWVLDPVGAGISKLRNELLTDLLAQEPTAIRGNASEILALDNFSASSSKGVDSTADSQDAFTAGRNIQRAYGSQVCISGATDYILGDKAWVEVKNGSPLMAKVTALGCTASAIVGAFLGLRKNPFEEAVAGVSVLSLAGEIAALHADGPGTLQVNLYDTLYNLSADALNLDLQISEHAYSS
ncbi:hydroxyethylthiazole kinase [Sphingobacterium oryzagri]|uniref:Hydroxyethylthiazole kinase n=1 Tax=Sphingobacterium oryzagri TaxID=3025669 RepID=A0ABY7WFW8_9SPHI|nr:hydroxyethylthiazole kinase [Sphingobacterium sp. KACC 22765]WDF67377.1 hydroxyethylthiazole kinase [Sphingobacterium sp. KACC 22765]